MYYISKFPKSFVGFRLVHAICSLFASRTSSLQYGFFCLRDIVLVAVSDLPIHHKLRMPISDSFLTVSVQVLEIKKFTNGL